MKKKKTQNKKPSVASILGLVLLGLVLVGVVANVIKDNPFKYSDNPTAVILTDLGEDITIEYEEGMTWAEWVESDYNTFELRVLPDYTFEFRVLPDNSIAVDIGDDVDVSTYTLVSDFQLNESSFSKVLSTEYINQETYFLFIL